MWNTYHRFLPSIVKTLLIVLGWSVGGIVLGILITLLLPLIQQGEYLTLDELQVLLFTLPALGFGIAYVYVYKHIAGHRPKLLLHDHITGYSLNKPVVYTTLEITAYLLGTFCFFSGSVLLSMPPSLGASVAFFFGSSIYLAIRLNYVLQPARDERAAPEREAEAWRAEAERQAATLRLTPQAVLASLVNQKSVIIGMTQDFVPVYYREEPRNEEQLKHTLIIAASGHGKTTCEVNLIAQNIYHNKGVIVLAAESDVFAKLLRYIPEERADDLIYFEPEDLTPPVIGFNPFTLGAGENLNQKIGETRTILKRAMGGDLGVTMVPMIDNVVSVLVRRPHATFADVMQLLNPADKTVRASLKTDPTLDPNERDFWKQYDESTYYRASYGAVYNRFSPFAQSPISTVLSTSSFSFKSLFRSGHAIVFLDLSQLRDKARVTMAQMLLASIEQALLSRNTDDFPYYLYVDEFQKYAEDSKETFIELYNGARKYKLGVTLAHQSMANIPTELMDTITDNVGTTIALHLSAKSAPHFAKQLQLASPILLQNLTPGQAYTQTPTHHIGVPVTIPVEPVVPLPRPVPDLKARSKQNFGTEPPTEPVLRDQPDQPDQPKPPPAQKKKSFGITFE